MSQRRWGKAPACQDVLEEVLRVFRWGRNVGRVVLDGLSLGVEEGDREEFLGVLLGWRAVL